MICRDPKEKTELGDKPIISADKTMERKRKMYLKNKESELIQAKIELADYVKKNWDLILLGYEYINRDALKLINTINKLEGK